MEKMHNWIMATLIKTQKILKNQISYVMKSQHQTLD